MIIEANGKKYLVIDSLPLAKFADNKESIVSRCNRSNRTVIVNGGQGIALICQELIEAEYTDIKDNKTEEIVAIG